MSFEARIFCDCCTNFYQFKADLPEDVNTEYLHKMPDGWFFDPDSEDDYCPSCAAKHKQ